MWLASKSSSVKDFRIDEETILNDRLKQISMFKKIIWRQPSETCFSPTIFIDKMIENVKGYYL